MPPDYARSCFGVPGGIAALAVCGILAGLYVVSLALPSGGKKPGGIGMEK
jgi:hypothetical protein